MNNKYVWYSTDIMDALNSLGYVHFITKEQSDPGSFIDQRAFYYDEDKKEYGYCDFIPGDYKDCTNNKFDIIKKGDLISRIEGGEDA